ncbi:MAG: cytochrome c oxidase assembly protein [Thiohalobacteraceae bacterium]
MILNWLQRARNLAPLLLLIFGEPAVAHVADGAHGIVWSSLDPWSVLLLLGMGWCYVRGRAIGRRRSRMGGGARRDALLFWTGWSVLFIALLPPVDTLGGQLFFMHMIQHELLILLSAPLLVLSRPAGRLLWGLPDRLRDGFVRLNRKRVVRRAGRWSLSPAGAWALHAVALWGWHLPVLFNASLASDAVHALQHLSFFVSALLFWSALLLSRDRSRNAVAIVYLFTTALHSGLLGVLLTFSKSPWYAPYAVTTGGFGYTPLEDQQLGGLIMWVPSSLVFLAAILVLAARLLEERAPSRHRLAYQRNVGKNHG